MFGSFRRRPLTPVDSLAQVSGNLTVVGWTAPCTLVAASVPAGGLAVALWADMAAVRAVPSATRSPR